MKFEPALIVQLVGAGLAMVAAFGLPVTGDQRQAILEFTAIVVAIMVGQGVVTRSFAYSEHTVDRLTSEAEAVGYERGVAGQAGS